MNKLSLAIPLSLLVAANFSFAQSTPAERPAEQGQSATKPTLRETVRETSGASGSAGSRASGGPATTEGNKALDTNIRGERNSASTSDRDTSRSWSGVGSTGGATGTGTSSGTTDEPPASGSSR